MSRDEIIARAMRKLGLDDLEERPRDPIEIPDLDANFPPAGTSLPPPAPTDTYTVADLAKRWRCGVPKVRAILKAEAIKTFKVGNSTRITIEEIRRYEGVEHEETPEEQTDSAIERYRHSLLH